MSIARVKGTKGKCDILFSKLIRSVGRCERCGAIENLQCSHIMSRSYSFTRTMLDNAQCLCAKCHYFFTNNPIEFSKWIFATIGEAKYDFIRAIAIHGIGQKFDWERELERLKGLFKEMEAGTWHRSVASGEGLV